MHRFKQQSGFAVIEIAIVIVIIGLIGYVGYIAYNGAANNTAADSTQVKQNPIATDVAPAPKIESTADLTTAEKALDDIATEDATDSAQLDSELSTF